MVQNNEFKGQTLSEALRRATARYPGGIQQIEYKRSCDVIELDIKLVKNQILDYSSEARSLEARAERLADEARRKLRTALVEALIALAGPLGAFGRVARIIGSLSRGSLSANDVRKLIPAIAAVLAAKDALEALDDIAQERILLAQAASLMDSARSSAEVLFSLLNEADNCEADPIS